MKTLLRSLIVTAMMVAGVHATEYALDYSHSQVGFKVKHMVISNVYGKFNEYDGSFSVVDGKLATLEGTVQAASIDTDNEKRDNHLRSADFFDAGKYPTLTMKLLSVDGEDAMVELTMRGVTKKVKMDLEFGGEIVDPWGNQRAGFQLEGKIDRKDFGLTWNKALETGGLVVGDEVKLIIAIEGKAK
jgi:polyisoprenoid-binding protein YceI